MVSIGLKTKIKYMEKKMEKYENAVTKQLIAFMAANDIDTLSAEQTINGYTVITTVEKPFDDCDEDEE